MVQLEGRKSKTKNNHLRKHLITIFGDKVQLVPSHSERKSREIDKEINLQLKSDGERLPKFIKNFTS